MAALGKWCAREIRTPGLLVRSQTLHPTELGAHMKKDVVAEREEQFLSYQDATFGANNPGGRATQSLRLSRVFGASARDSFAAIVIAV